MNRWLEVQTFAQRAPELGLTPLPYINCAPGASVDPHLPRQIQTTDEPCLHMGWVNPWYDRMGQGPTLQDIAIGIRSGVFPFDRACEYLRPNTEPIRAAGQAQRIASLYWDVELPFGPEFDHAYPGLKGTGLYSDDDDRFTKIMHAEYQTARALAVAIGCENAATHVLGVSRAGNALGDGQKPMPGIPGTYWSTLQYTFGTPAQITAMPEEIKRNVPGLTQVHLDTRVGRDALLRQLDVCEKLNVAEVIVFPGTPPETVLSEDFNVQVQQIGRYLDSIVAQGGLT